MAAPDGTSASLSMMDEVTYGIFPSTYSTGLRGLDLVMESLKLSQKRIESAGLRQRRFLASQQWTSGERQVAGDIDLELANVNQGVLFKHILGAISTAAGPPVVHTAVPGDLTGKSFTAQIGRPTIGGTIQGFTYLGCKVNVAALSCKAGEIAKLKLTIVAQDESTASTFTAPTYPALMVPMTFVGGFLQVGGAQVDVHDVSLTINNHLDPNRFFLRSSALSKEPLESGWRDVNGTFIADFTDLTLYNRYVTNAEAALVLNFTGGAIAGGGTYGTVITCNVRFDGETPTVAGPALLTNPMPFKAIGNSSSDTSVIQIAYTTSDAAP